MQSRGARGLLPFCRDKSGSRLRDAWRGRVHPRGHGHCRLCGRTQRCVRRVVARTSRSRMARGRPVASTGLKGRPSWARKPSLWGAPGTETVMSRSPPTPGRTRTRTATTPLSGIGLSGHRGARQSLHRVQRSEVRALRRRLINPSGLRIRSTPRLCPCRFAGVSVANDESLVAGHGGQRCGKAGVVAIPDLDPVVSRPTTPAIPKRSLAVSCIKRFHRPPRIGRRPPVPMFARRPSAGVR